MENEEKQHPPRMHEVFVGSGFHEDREYQFYRVPNGNPPGQIKARVRTDGGEKRVFLRDLPSPALQSTFISLTGKTREELEPPAASGGW